MQGLFGIAYSHFRFRTHWIGRESLHQEEALDSYERDEYDWAACGFEVLWRKAACSPIQRKEEPWQLLI